MANVKNYTLDEFPIDIYFQKSSKFLFPLLKHKGEQIKPIQTYLAWDGEVGINEYKLVCLYEMKTDYEFTQFEKKTLQANELFDSFHKGEDNKGVYLFNLRKYREDVMLFLKGKYSQMSDESKAIIVDFYSLNKYSTEYMDSYLNPENYFEKYAQLLNIPEWRLRDVGELCDPYNRVKETLSIKKVKAIYNMDKLVLF